MYLQKAIARTQRRVFFYQRWKSLENLISQKIWTWTWALLVNLFCCGWCADSIWFYNWFCYYCRCCCCCRRLNGAAMSEFTFQKISRWVHNYTFIYTERQKRSKKKKIRRGIRWRIAKNLPYECVLVIKKR